MRKIDRQTLELFLASDEIKFGVAFEQYNNETLQGFSEHGYIEFEYQSGKPSVKLEGFTFTVNYQVLIDNEPLQNVSGLFIVSFTSVKCRYLKFLLKDNDEIKFTVTIDNILPVQTVELKIDVYRGNQWICETTLPVVYLAQIGQVFRYRMESV